MPTRLVLAVLAAAVVAGGCAVIRTVDPTETDPAITRVAGDHVVAVPVDPIEPLDRLVVFFPGSGATPDAYETLLWFTAAQGFHTVALDYRNELSINFDICRDQSGECHEEARLEILTGTDSEWVTPDVDEANSAYGRLEALLAQQVAAHPDEGWDLFLTAQGEPRWDLVVAAGHSQGGGHAAMTAKLHEVDRVLMFGATEPQAWTEEPFATPADRFWGLVHLDERVSLPVRRSWTNIGIPGPVIVTDTDVPAVATQRIVTSTDACGGDPDSFGHLHNCYVADEWLPPANDDGSPAFGAIWQHMLLG